MALPPPVVKTLQLPPIIKEADQPEAVDLYSDNYELPSQGSSLSFSQEEMTKYEWMEAGERVSWVALIGLGLLICSGESRSSVLVGSASLRRDTCCLAWIFLFFIMCC